MGKKLDDTLAVLTACSAITSRALATGLRPRWRSIARLAAQADP